MNKTELRANILTLTDADSTDIPTALADMFLSEAFEHCAQWVRYWPFYRNTWTISLLASDYSFTLQDLVDQDANSTATLYHFTRQNQITSITDTTNDRTLTWIPYDEMVANRETSTSTTSAGPQFWSYRQTVVADTIDVGYVSAWVIEVWPTPSAAYDLRIEGYRDPIDAFEVIDGGSSDVGGFVAAGEPDMPKEFHQAIQNYAVGQAFAYLDEPERSMFYIAKADNALRQLEDKWMAMPQTDAPMVMSGDGLRFKNTLAKRLRYDWEA